MNISNYLKNIEKTKVELAKELYISRPTLNQYIDLFESGCKIENERYELIFHRLFSDENLSREEFDKRMDSIKYLLERDRKYDIDKLKPESADIVARIHYALVRDMNEGNGNNKVYETILLLLNSYHTESFMRELAGYLYDLNSDTDLLDLSDESKAYYAFFYKCFSKIKDAAPKYDEVEFASFLRRKEEISNEKKKRREDTKRRIQDKFGKLLEKIVIEYKKEGIDASENEIMKEFIRRVTL